MAYIYSKYVPVIKALSDETRLKIVDMLSCGSMCACDILELVDISQSTLSYHMKILTESGLIKGVKDGSWVRYSINKEISRPLQSFIVQLTEEKEDCICNNLNNELKSVCNINQN